LIHLVIDLDSGRAADILNLADLNNLKMTPRQCRRTAQWGEKELAQGTRCDGQRKGKKAERKGGKQFVVIPGKTPSWERSELAMICVLVQALISPSVKMPEGCVIWDRAVMIGGCRIHRSGKQASERGDVIIINR
jgi:hypothetical protein